MTDGNVSGTFEQLLLNFNGDLVHDKTPQDYIASSIMMEQSIAQNKSKLTADETEFLYSMTSGIKFTARYMEDNNLTVLPLVAARASGIPCGVATVVHAAGFVGLCLASGPIGWTVGVIGFASGVYGVFESC